MITFEELLTSIKISEGYVSKIYLCPSGVRTIGYGFTSSCFVNGAMPETMTKGQADAKLEEIVRAKMTEVGKYLNIWGYNEQERNILLIPLTDFTYNCGIANLKNLTRSGDRSIYEILEKITEYNKGNGKVLQGLVKRRQIEKEWILENMKGIEKEPEEHSAKELQTLVNSIYGKDVLKVDGAIGKNSIKYIYALLLKLL